MFALQQLRKARSHKCQVRLVLTCLKQFTFTSLVGDEESPIDQFRTSRVLVCYLVCTAATSKGASPQVPGASSAGALRTDFCAPVQFEHVM